MTEAAWADHTWFGTMAYWLGIAAALITAFYSWRLILMTFHGKPRAEAKVMDYVHESPRIMLYPLYILAVGAVLSGSYFYGGYVGAPHGAGHGEEHAQVQEHNSSTSDAHSALSEAVLKAEHHAEQKHEEGAQVGSHRAENNIEYVNIWNKDYFWGDSIRILPDNDTVVAAHGVPFWVKKLPIVVALFGIFLAYVVYSWKEGLSSVVVRVFKPIHTLFFNKWFFDEIYERLFVRNSLSLGRLFSISDKKVIDGLGPDGFASMSQKTGGIFGRIQSGFVYHYAFAMIIGLIALLTWFLYDAGIFSGL